MKAMQSKVIAIITNMVLALALIVVAGTMSSDVTGNSEGEQAKLDKNESSVVAGDASLSASDDFNVGESVEKDNGEIQDVIDSVTDESAKDVVENCDVDKNGNTAGVPQLQPMKPEHEEIFLANVSGVLNVRAEANEEAEIVGKIYAGQGGKVIWKGEEWSHVRSGNVLGYVKNEYVWFGEDAKSHIETDGQLYAVIKADSLKVRLQADKSSPSLGSVVNGQKLHVLEKGKEWTKVIFENATAYVSTSYVEFEREIGSGVTAEEELVAAEAEKARKEAVKAEEERKRKEAEEKKRKEEEALKKAIANSGVAEIVKTSKMEISAEDAYLIACCVSAEVGNATYECQLAVANIILNRYKAGYASTIRGVIYARMQFTVTTNGMMDRYLKNGPKASCVQAVKDALDGNNNMVGYYNFCYRPSAKFSKYKEYIILGTEVFYKLK